MYIYTFVCVLASNIWHMWFVYVCLYMCTGIALEWVLRLYWRWSVRRTGHSHHRTSLTSSPPCFIAWHLNISLYIFVCAVFIMRVSMITGDGNIRSRERRVCVEPDWPLSVCGVFRSPHRMLWGHFTCLFRPYTYSFLVHHVLFTVSIITRCSQWFIMTCNYTYICNDTVQPFIHHVALLCYIYTGHCVCCPL